MKLTLNRREEQKGMLFKKTVYSLDIDLEVDDAEKALIKKHKWGELPMATGTFVSGAEITLKIGALLGKNTYTFSRIEELAHFERQIVEEAKTLKANLATAGNFTDNGPREVSLD